MKLKIFLSALILLFIFGIVGSAIAMTEQEKQVLINQIQQQLADLQQQVAQQTGAPTNWCHTFNSNLGYASSGNGEVAQLHTAMQKEGFSFSPDGTNVYSDGTSRAVVNFQAKYGISPQSGFVGTKTRSKLNSLYACTSTSTTTTIATTTPAVCNATCVTQTEGVYALDCKGKPTKCPAGNTCKQTFNTTYSYVNGAVQTIQTITGSQCVTPTSTTNNTNVCNASCKTQTDGVYALDCNGNPTKCKTGYTCQQTYSSALKTINGVVQTVQTLNGAKCSCTTNWQCGAYGACGSSGTQTRTCTDLNSCGTTTDKPATTQSCTACVPRWTCSGFSTCANGQQIQTCTDSNNCGTTTGRPSLTQSCYSCNASCKTQTDGVYALDCNGNPTKCKTGYTCQQTYSSALKTINGVVQTVQTLNGAKCSCTTNWQCGAYGACGSSGTQTRTCTDLNSCGTTTDKPATTQSCTACVPRWTCSGFSTCANGQQIQTCTDSNNCGTTTGRPSLTQSCFSCDAACVTQSDGLYAIDCYGHPTKCNSGYTCEQTFSSSMIYVNGVVQTVQTLTGARCICTTNWHCGDYVTCSSSGTQTRICTDLNNCGITTDKPATSRTCTPPAN